MSSTLSLFCDFQMQRGSGRFRTVGGKSIIELSTGEVYRVRRFSSKAYSKGTKVEVMESALSNNVNRIKI